MAKRPTLYHASPVRFRHGDLIVGGRKGGSGYAHVNVCMTTSPLPHQTIISNIPGWKGHASSSDGSSVPGRDPTPVTDRDWYVYEVEPIGPVSYEPSNAEYQARTAMVIRNLGKAKTFLRRVERAIDEPTAERDFFRKHYYSPDELAYSPDVQRDRLRKSAERRERVTRRIDPDFALVGRTVKRNTAKRKSK